MASLNQGKIVKSLEAIIKGSNEDFIWEFLKIYRTPPATIKRLLLGDSQRNVARIEGDLGVAQKLYFRALAEGASLSGAFQEIKGLPVLEANKIRFVMVTDFKTVVAWDRKVDDRVEFEFSELPVNYEFFLPMTGLYEKAIAYAEHPADVKACEKMGRLYDSIRTINHYEKNELHALNVFLTRLLFCFFAEDTGIFPVASQMSLALQSNTLADGSDTADFFEKLFTVLDLPEDSEARKEYPASFQTFPYVNGTLFSEKPRIPRFDAKSRRLLLDCASMKWSDISPVIFGSMFQAVMDPEKRRSLGAHYTSEKNIMKVVRPLFLDELEEEFQKIQAMSRGKVKALKEFHKKLGSLGFLDPACGCGNFLIVSYRELRELELRVLLEMKKEAPAENLWMNVSMACKVSINQFYGIEIEEFPVDIARVSMWLMEHVMNLKLGKTFGLVVSSIPLKHSATIICTNALTTPWQDVIAFEKLNYILGNPPFAGTTTTSLKQKNEIDDIFEGQKVGYLDYVGCWFMKAAKFMQHTDIKAAFVATNSICQGEQVEYLWEKLFILGIHINFAYRTFKWKNEAKNNAAVFCVVIGFSYIIKNQYLFSERNDEINNTFIKIIAKNINSYLIDAPNVIIKGSSNSLSAPLNMVYGNKPTDGGNLIVEVEDYDCLLDKHPEIAPYVHRLLGAVEFLHNKKRYCLWLKDAPKNILLLSEVKIRLNNVKSMRLASKAVSTRDYANFPHLFRQITQPEGCDFLLIPTVSSERRKYIPIGYIDKSVRVNNSVHIIPNATHYDFAILTSAMHMAWMRTVCGRLKSDYRYSRDLCYNTFPWPTVSDTQKKSVETLAEQVLMTREMYPEMTLADMYDPDKMPTDLREAHHALDMAVDALYRKKPFENDEERLQLLFQLYEKLVKWNPDKASSEADEEEDDA